MQGALPLTTRPPQSPGSRSPTSNSEVITIGMRAVPAAMIFDPGFTTRTPWFTLPPKTKVPGSIVSVAPPSMNVGPFR